MYCSECGSELNGEKFCPKCGTKTEQGGSEGQRKAEDPKGPKDKKRDVIKIFSAVFVCIFGIYALKNFFGVGIGNVFRLFSGYFWAEEVFGIFLRIAISMAIAVGYSSMAGLMIVLYKRFRKEDAGIYFLLASTGSAILVLLKIARILVAQLFFKYHYARNESFFFFLLMMTLYVGGLFILFTELHADPLSRMRDGDIVDAVKNSVREVTKLGKAVFQADGKKEKDVMENGNFDNMNSIEPQTCMQNNGENFRHFVRANENRSLLSVVLLSIITCGIYHYIYIYSITNDINLVCEGDGKETSGIVKYLLFSFFTCGIYTLYWHYTFLNRLAENAPRYGKHFEENGTTYLLWTIFGSMLCGIGHFVALHIQIKNLNALCAAYNRANGI